MTLTQPDSPLVWIIYKPVKRVPNPFWSRIPRKWHLEEPSFQTKTYYHKPRLPSHRFHVSEPRVGTVLFRGSHHSCYSSFRKKEKYYVKKLYLQINSRITIIWVLYSFAQLFVHINSSPLFTFSGIFYEVHNTSFICVRRTLLLATVRWCNSYNSCLLNVLILSPFLWSYPISPDSLSSGQ